MIIVEMLNFTKKENELWQKIGSHFGCDRNDAIRWYLAGAPITLIDGRKPFANMSKLETWLRNKFFVAPEYRLETLEKLSRKTVTGTPPVLFIAEGFLRPSGAQTEASLWKKNTEPPHTQRGLFNLWGS